MCPLWPFHYLFTYIVIIVPLWILSFRAVESGAADTSTKKWDFVYEPATVRELLVGDSRIVRVKFRPDSSDYWAVLGNQNQLEFKIRDENIASVFPSKLPWNDLRNYSSSSETEKNFQNLHHQNGTNISYTEYSEYSEILELNITGKFLGYTKLCLQQMNETAQEAMGALRSSLNCIEISVIRKAGYLDKAFTISVALLVGIIYINMGAALDMPTIKETLKKPYGPAIGLFSQFVIMPLLSYGLARWLIPYAGLQLGLFITGCSPGGGASNIWTLTLGGNLDLSITMTTISTLSAFAMMPAWILTLGATIFEEAHLTIPYSKIGVFAGALIGPLFIGYGIQRTFPNFAKSLVRGLRPFAVFLIVYIVLFAVYTNLYLFQLLTWEILLSGMLLPWMGYLLGGGLAILFRRDWEDVIAISIETGVQNTGLAIFALRFSLPQPEADLTTVLPVAVAMMTPVIPTLVFIYQKIRGGRDGKSNGGFTLAQKEDSSVETTPSPSV